MLNCPRLTRCVFPLLVLAVIFLPGLASCAPGAPMGDCPGGTCGEAPVLIVPGCDAEPGLTQPPGPIEPLAPLTDSIFSATTAGSLPGAGRVDPTGEYHYRIPLDVPAGRAGMQYYRHSGRQ
jgi:hypothetical protein